MIESSVAVLAGGVGAARFLQGLVDLVDPDGTTAIVNTGDDLTFHGVHVSPDVDIVMYTLAGLVDESRGWGLRGDTFASLESLRKFGLDAWFGLGDRDLGTCLARTSLMRDGATLSEATDRLRRALDVGTRLIPMTDDPVATRIITPDGELAFQEYFVKRAQRDDVLGVRLDGAESAVPAPGLLDALDAADVIVIAPSNPFVSIGTILSIAGIREVLRDRRSRVVAISPIIGGEAVKGPAAKMLASLGAEVSAFGVAQLYQDIAGAFLLDDVDVALAPRIAGLDVRPIVAPTLMSGLPEKRALAATALAAVGVS